MQPYQLSQIRERDYSNALRPLFDAIAQRQRTNALQAAGYPEAQPTLSTQDVLAMEADRRAREESGQRRTINELAIAEAQRAGSPEALSRKTRAEETAIEANELLGKQREAVAQKKQLEFVREGLRTMPFSDYPKFSSEMIENGLPKSFFPSFADEQSYNQWRNQLTQSPTDLKAIADVLRVGILQRRLGNMPESPEEDFARKQREAEMRANIEARHRRPEKPEKPEMSGKEALRTISASSSKIAQLQANLTRLGKNSRIDTLMAIADPRLHSAVGSQDPAAIAQAKTYFEQAIADQQAMVDYAEQFRPAGMPGKGKPATAKGNPRLKTAVDYLKGAGTDKEEAKRRIRALMDPSKRWTVDEVRAIEREAGW